MPRPIIRQGSKSGPVEVKNITKVGRFERSIVLMNEKQQERFIKRIESICRSSPEYKDYIAYLRNHMDMNRCSFYENVTNKYSKKISIEIHHEPFTLFDIVNIVVDKWLKEDKDLNPYLIADEVMRIHYTNLVGLIPLSITVHQLVHDGKLFVPIQCVKGDFNTFVKIYWDYINPNLKAKLKHKAELSKQAVDMSILEKKFIYLKVDGWSLPAPIPKDKKFDDKEIMEEKAI